MQDSREPTPYDLARLFVRGFWLALTAALLAGAVAYFVSRSLPATFQAEATLVHYEEVPGFSGPGVVPFTPPPLALETYASTLRSRTVLGDALSRTNGAAVDAEGVASLREAMTVRAEDADVSSLLRVRVEDGRPERARDLANAVAEALVAWDRERSATALEGTIAGLEAQVEALRGDVGAGEGARAPDMLDDAIARLSAARALRNGLGVQVAVLEQAVAPAEPAAPRPLRAALVVSGLGFLLTYAILMIRAPLLTEPVEPTPTRPKRSWVNEAR